MLIEYTYQKLIVDSENHVWTYPMLFNDVRNSLKHSFEVVSSVAL